MPYNPYQLPDDQPLCIVKPDKKFIVEPVSGSGFALLPGARNVGGFPLVVEVNDQGAKRRHVVTGPQWINGLLDGAKLSFDATLGGGIEGDTWTLTVRPISETSETPRPRSNAEGFLQVRGGGARELFRLSTTDDYGPWATAFNGGAEGLFYISPAAPKAFSVYAGMGSASFQAWNVSSFKHAAFYIDEVSALGPSLAWSVQPFVEITHSVSGRTMKYIPAGDVGEFGDNSVTPWATNTPGYIEFGTGATVTTDFDHQEARTPPFLRFGLLVAGNAQDWNIPPSPAQFDFTLVGLVW